MTKHSKLCLALMCLLLTSSMGWAQQRHKVIINQDGSGPGGSNMQTLALLIQSPQDGPHRHSRRARGGPPPGAAVKTQLYMDIDVDHGPSVVSSK